jgi:hypothetical protein
MTAAAEDQRILLYRPAAGLNDTLCQIELACRYGERFGRKVIVEADFATTGMFRHAFSNYFVSTDPNLILDAADYRAEFDRLAVAPKELFGRVNAYVARWDGSILRSVDTETSQPLSPDMSIDYAETLLVSHSTGATGDAPQALARMKLHPILTGMLFERLRAIGQPYEAIHIRHTDYETDYGPLVERIRAAAQGPVFLATDHHGVLRHVRAVFGEARVFSFARLPEAPDRPLHHLREVENVFERNSDSILDLLMLALARRLWVLPLKPNIYGARYSGFSVLANQLQDTPAILRGLLAGADQATVLGA